MRLLLHAGKRLSRDEVAHESRDIPLRIVDWPLRCEDVALHAACQALSRYIAQRDALLEHVMLIARERLGMDMPVHVLIRALCELLYRIKVIEVQEALVDATEAPLGILPEGRQREARDEVAP